jgi:hypothetical protein
MIWSSSSSLIRCSVVIPAGKEMVPFFSRTADPGILNHFSGLPLIPATDAQNLFYPSLKTHIFSSQRPD